VTDSPAANAARAAAVVAVPPRLDGTIVLVRHGESTWVAEGRIQGRADPPLSELGRRQAALVAARLADPASMPPLPVPAGSPLGCWHSPLRRAAETARSIGDARAGLPLHADDRLREISQGEWEGLTGADVLARYPAVRAGWRRDPVHVHAPGGESLPEAGRRAGGFAGELLAHLADARARPAGEAPGPPPGRTGSRAFEGIEHGGKAGPPLSAGPVPWAIIVAHEGLLRVLLLELLGLPLDAFWRFPLGLCAISVVDIRDGRQTLRAHNLLDHLAPLGATAAADAVRDRGAGL
jgi:broad specificity phosphatase PhoE